MMPMNMNLHIKRTITDKNGKIVKEWKEKVSRSFVIAWLQYFSCALGHPWGSDSDPVNIQDTGDGTRATSFAALDMNQAFSLEAAAASVLYGILAGTGTTPPATEDYALETLIAEGAAATQLNYGATSVLTANIVGASVELPVTRAMVNNSGGAITVKEVGMVIRHGGYYLLMVHDAVNDVIPDGNTYTVTYTFKTTV